jgi:hypothetical protein
MRRNLEVLGREGLVAYRTITNDPDRNRPLTSVNRRVAGSNPARGANPKRVRPPGHIAAWAALPNHLAVTLRVIRHRYKSLKVNYLRHGPLFETRLGCVRSAVQLGSPDKSTMKLATWLQFQSSSPRWVCLFD